MHGQVVAIARTRPGSPSKLATFRACPLRYLLETEGLAPSPIRPHPATLLGTAVHEVAEALLEGQCAGGTHLEMLEAKVASQLEDASRIGPIATWVKERFGVRGLITRRQLVDQANFAKSLAERFASGGARPFRPTGSGQAVIPEGSERWLQSNRLGIAGKVDLICREAEHRIRIIDFKSGRVNDDEGRPKSAYLLQLAAYGRIAKEIEPRTAVQLELVGRADDWSGEFDASLHALADEVLAELHAILPTGAQVNPREFSRPGEHCAQCQHRPGCERYNELLDERMATTIPAAEGGLPPDISAQVVGVVADGDLCTLKCIASNGFNISIARVPTVLAGDPMPGARLRAYGLGALEARRQEVFACNFFVVDLETPRNSAFQAALFLDQV